jgi:hypothetical protein
MFYICCVHQATPSTQGPWFCNQNLLDLPSSPLFLPPFPLSFSLFFDTDPEGPELEGQQAEIQNKAAYIRN